MKGKIMLSEKMDRYTDSLPSDIFDQDLPPMAVKLGWWRDLFNAVFFNDQPCPSVKITLEKTKVTTLSHSVIGRDPAGVGDRINLNPIHLNRPWWDVLASLLHELTHAWQAIHGNPSRTWYHNQEFRIRLADCGIYCDESGRHVGLGDPFLFLVQRHGISLEDTKNLPKSGSGVIHLKPPAIPKGTSKLKLWQCDCGQKVRVGRKDFQATCDLCGAKFRRID